MMYQFEAPSVCARSMLARLTEMDERRAALAIFGGTLVSGVLTILGVYGLVGGLQYLLR